MILKLRAGALTPAETSFLSWQFGFEDDDDRFLPALWRAIDQAWLSDLQRMSSMDEGSSHLSRLAAPGAFPDEVGVFRRFKSDDGERYWLDMLKRAGIADRRQRSVMPSVERRRARSGATRIRS
ncbi:MAG: hypothetical protein IPL03_11145 [Sterolibacteriaceae bacterium]|nr:hypothetical protein [Candidatus Methylophosphatis haderslevensis]